jgi:hypothetical protein
MAAARGGVAVVTAAAPRGGRSGDRDHAGRIAVDEAVGVGSRKGDGVDPTGSVVENGKRTQARKSGVPAGSAMS